MNIPLPLIFPSETIIHPTYKLIYAQKKIQEKVQSIIFTGLYYIFSALFIFITSFLFHIVFVAQNYYITARQNQQKIFHGS